MKTSRTATTLIAILIALTLTGCVTGATPKETATTMTERPALEPPDGLSTDTPEQLLTWTIHQVDDVVAVLGPNYNWEDQGSPPHAWNPSDRESYRPGSCGAEDSDIGQYNIQINGTDTIPDPEALATKVRDFWESRGYTVGQIGPAKQDESRLLELTVFLNNKAGLSYAVGTEGHSIQVTSECARVW